ncbi:MAG: hypothetical protein H6874_13220 [Hyphomicrobiaceae bacterium]|nr:hypothetical protein [Hyphomicrobiaceae bacterium]
MTAPAPIVFFDIAGPDLAAQVDFYSKVFNWDIAPTGQVAVPVTTTTSGLLGTLREEPKEAILYMGVEDIPGTLAKVEEHGGKTFAPRFKVPGVVVLGLFTDPAGNRMGLVEMKDGVAVVP